jgi:hypothetical protein
MRHLAAYVHNDTNLASRGGPQVHRPLTQNAAPHARRNKITCAPAFRTPRMDCQRKASSAHDDRRGPHLAAKGHSCCTRAGCAYIPIVHAHRRPRPRQVDRCRLDQIFRQATRERAHRKGGNIGGPGHLERRPIHHSPRVVCKLKTNEYVDLLLLMFFSAPP